MPNAGTPQEPVAGEEKVLDAVTDQFIGGYIRSLESENSSLRSRLEKAKEVLAYEFRFPDTGEFDPWTYIKHCKEVLAEINEKECTQGHHTCPEGIDSYKCAYCGHVSSTNSSEKSC